MERIRLNNVKKIHRISERKKFSFIFIFSIIYIYMLTNVHVDTVQQNIKRTEKAKTKEIMKA